MSKTPPKDYLNRTLWAMGHNEEHRKIIIDTSRKMTAISGAPFDPIDLGAFCMPIPKLPKQKWYVRFKFWLRRMWREIIDRIVLPRITECRFKFEPRDLWIGVYWDVKDADRAYYVSRHMWWMIVHFYVTIVPMVPLFMEVWFPRKKAKDV